MRGRLAPGAGFNVLSRMVSSSLHPQQMRRGLDHPAVLRSVCDRDGLVPPAKPEPAHGRRDARELAVSAFDQRHAQMIPGRIGAHATISSRLLPRFAAISSGERTLDSASIVARTTLIGFLYPFLFAPTLPTPTHSSPPRIPPPAMTPVPSEAGCIRTRVEPCSP